MMGEAPRSEKIQNFLGQNGWANAGITKLVGDASPRVYTRLARGKGKAILMDAPPPQDIRPFLDVTAALKSMGLSAPTILAQDIDLGLILLEDLGDGLYKSVLQNAGHMEEELYTAAVEILLKLVHDRASFNHRLAAYNAPVLAQEMLQFSVWWLPGMLSGSALIAAQREFKQVALAIIDQMDIRPMVPVLRDYHAENLLWLPARSGDEKVGLLDYQDALKGHPAYDLVSLLQDARRDVSKALESSMIDRFIQGGGALDLADFMDDYDRMNAQRNFKILGVFARLWLRDGRADYLAMMPRVWGYIERCLDSPSMAPLKSWLERWIPEDMRNLVPDSGEMRDCFTRASEEMSAGAMLLAAGKGTRMGDMSATLPKPLVEVAGRNMLDRALDHLAKAGIEAAVVNVHHLADQIEQHISHRPGGPDIYVSDERAELLETGGGVRKALGLLDESFLAINSDIIWVDGPSGSTIKRLQMAFDPITMDGLLLLVPVEKAVGYDGVGDFYMDEKGRVTPRGDRPNAPYVFGAVQMIRREALRHYPIASWSRRRHFRDAAKAGRLYGLIHDGIWLHVGTPEAVVEAERILTNLGHR